MSVGTGGPVGTGTCPAPTAANAMTDTLTYYDGKTTAGVIGIGRQRHARPVVLDSYTGSTPNYVATASARHLRRVRPVDRRTDARGLVTDHRVHAGHRASCRPRSPRPM